MSTFAEVRNYKGQNRAIACTVVDIDKVSYTTEGKAKQRAILADDTGEQQNVTIYQGRGDLLGEQLRNTKQHFLLKLNQYGYYGGFWQTDNPAAIDHNAAQVPPQISPENQQKIDSIRQQMSKPAQPKQTDWDAIAEGKVRCQVLCAMIKADVKIDYDLVREFTKFIMTGKAPGGQDNTPEF